ncbi:MAG: hypothetical protein ACLRL6_08400 [Clostridium sp.]
MSRKQAKLEKLSIELIRLYFEEHDFELLKEYLSDEISMMGEHRSALCHGMQEVERALQEVSIIYGEMVHLQDVYCEIIYQKQDIAVVAFTCIQHALGSGLLCRLKVSLVWEMEAGDGKSATYINPFLMTLQSVKIRQFIKIQRSCQYIISTVIH